MISRILDFIEFRGIRVLDFVRLIDRKCKMMVTKSEFKKGLVTCEIPMRSSQVDKLFRLLDAEDKGYAEYKDFVKVIRKDFQAAFTKNRNNHQ